MFFLRCSSPDSSCLVLKKTWYICFMRWSFFISLSRNERNFASFAFFDWSSLISWLTCWAFFWFSWILLTASSVTLLVSSLTSPELNSSNPPPISSAISFLVSKICFYMQGNVCFCSWNSTAILYIIITRFFRNAENTYGEVDERLKSARC